MIAAQLLAGQLPLSAPWLDFDVLDKPLDWWSIHLLDWLFGVDLEAAAHRLMGLIVPLQEGVGALPYPTNPKNPARIENYCPACVAAYHSLQPLGTVALAVCLLARIGKFVLGSSRAGMSPVHLVVDFAWRLLLGAAALQLSFPVLDFLSAGSIAVAEGLALKGMSVALGHPDVELATALLLFAPMNLFSSTLTQLLFMLLLGYLAVMVIASRIAIVFAALASPFAIPALTYSADGTVALLWLRMVLFATAVPPAAVICLTITILIFQMGLQVGATIPFVSALPLLAAIWLTVKAVNGLTHATIRSAAAGAAGTLQAAGLGPAVRGVDRMRRGAAGGVERAARTGRTLLTVAALARRGGLGPPAPGENGSFDLFCAGEFLRRGISRNEGNDLSEQSKNRWRTLFWARYLAREAGGPRPREHAA
jgi:hypothetical protein